jgi:hypothetical protein
MFPTPEECDAERRQRRRVRLMVDLTAACLYQDRSLRPGDAMRMIHGLRRAVLVLFPDCGRTFDLVIRPRLARILAERWGGCYGVSDESG